MLSVERELGALKFLDGLSTHLKDVREPHKALRHALRDTCEFFRARQGCIAELRAGHSEADLLFTLPKVAAWDRSVLARYFPPYPTPPNARWVGPRRGESGARLLVAPGHAFDGTTGA
jgi:hypothetical protein